MAESTDQVVMDESLRFAQECTEDREYVSPDVPSLMLSWMAVHPPEENAIYFPPTLEEAFDRHFRSHELQKSFCVRKQQERSIFGFQPSFDRLRRAQSGAWSSWSLPESAVVDAVQQREKDAEKACETASTNQNVNSSPANISSKSGSKERDSATTQQDDDIANNEQPHIVRSLKLRGTVWKARWSDLSLEEHVTFIDLSRKKLDDVKAGRQGTSEALLQGSSLQLYKELALRVAQERREYQEFLLENIFRYRNEYNFITKPVQQVVQAVLKRRNSQCGVLYPPKIRRMSVFVDIAKIQTAPGDPVLSHHKTVLQRGSVAKFDWKAGALMHNATRKRKKGSAVSADVQWTTIHPYLDAKKCSTGGRGQPARPYFVKASPLPVVSKDVDAHKLALLHGVDIVISSSTISRIVDNIAPFVDSWDLPVVSKDVLGKVDGEDVHRRVIFLDKPLVPDVSTMRSKNEKYFKQAIPHIGLSQNLADAKDFGEDEVQDVELDSEASLQKYPLTGTVGDNVTYNIWKFGALKLLVRCHIPGLLRDKEAIKYITFAAKLEYQPHLGWERITPQERCRWWIRTFLRPDANLLLGRFSPFQPKLMSLDQMDMVRILQGSVSFHPARVAKVLFEVCQRAKELPKGFHVLSHTTKESHITLFSKYDSERNNSPMAMRESQDSELVIEDEIGDVNVMEEPGKGEGYGVVDLERKIKNAGGNDLVTVPFVATEWKPVPNHIPFTFPIRYPKRHFPGVSHCHSYASCGLCCNGPLCSFTHYTMDELNEYESALRAKQSKVSLPKGKRARRAKGDTK